MVSKLLEKAIAEAAKLSSEEQDEIAALILGELESDEKWDDLFKSSSDHLQTLSDEALLERREGKSRKLDPNEL